MTRCARRWEAAVLATALLLLPAVGAANGQGILDELQAIEDADKPSGQKVFPIAEILFGDWDDASAAIPWLEQRLRDEDAPHYTRAVAASGLMWLDDMERMADELKRMARENPAENHIIARQAIVFLVIQVTESTPGAPGSASLHERALDHRPLLADLTLELLTLALMGDEDGEPLPDVDDGRSNTAVTDSIQAYQILCIQPDFGRQDISDEQRARNRRFREMVLTLLPEDAEPDGPEYWIGGLDQPTAFQLAEVLPAVTPDGSVRSFGHEAHQEVLGLHQDPEGFLERLRYHAGVD